MFALAAMSKLLRVEETTASFAALGLPLASVGARAVPVVELGIAVALVVVPPAGAVVGLVALAVFSAVLVLAIRRGVTAPCRCFGALGAAKVSWRQLARNAALAVAAVIVLLTA